MSSTLLLLALLPFAFAPADQTAEPASKPGTPRVKMVDKQDIPLEDLAHNFFFHTADPEMLQNIISAEGIDRLAPELAEHRRDMTDLQKIAPKMRRMCSELQSAENGQEFAAVFIQAQERDRNEMRQAARRVLSRLGADDMNALERYLDTEYRQGFSRGELDYQAMFASGAFPSPESNLLMQRTCDSASQMEMRSEP